jgi:2-haloacid dehalogenase
MPAFEQFELVTFDCYGTLIDWESGILGVLEPLLEHYDAPLDRDRILQLYSDFEPEAQSGGYLPYRAVLRFVLTQYAANGGFSLEARDAHALSESIARWEPFAETVPALRALAARYPLAILSNIDDDQFEHSRAQLGVPFAHVVTAQQVRSYKPGEAHFREILRRTGLPASRIVHVAESRFHDVAPAKALGFTTVWVNRRAGRPAAASRFVEVEPDLTVPNLAALVEAVEKRWNEVAT